MGGFYSWNGRLTEGSGRKPFLCKPSQVMPVGEALHTIMWTVVVFTLVGIYINSCLLCFFIIGVCFYIIRGRLLHSSCIRRLALHLWHMCVMQAPFERAPFFYTAIFLQQVVVCAIFKASCDRHTVDAAASLPVFFNMCCLWHPPHHLLCDHLSQEHVLPHTGDWLTARRNANGWSWRDCNKHR